MDGVRGNKEGGRVGGDLRKESPASMFHLAR